MILQDQGIPVKKGQQKLGRLLFIPRFLGQPFQPASQRREKVSRPLPRQLKQEKGRRRTAGSALTLRVGALQIIPKRILRPGLRKGTDGIIEHRAGIVGPISPMSRFCVALALRNRLKSNIRVIRPPVEIPPLFPVAVMGRGDQLHTEILFQIAHDCLGISLPRGV